MVALASVFTVLLSSAGFGKALADIVLRVYEESSMCFTSRERSCVICTRSETMALFHMPGIRYGASVRIVALPSLTWPPYQRSTPCPRFQMVTVDAWLHIPMEYIVWGHHSDCRDLHGNEITTKPYILMQRVSIGAPVMRATVAFALSVPSYPTKRIQRHVFISAM